MTLAILYATREGQTRRIAERLAGMLHARGVAIESMDVARLPPDFELTDFESVVLAASIHGGQHEREMVRFVKQHGEDLAKRPTTLLSISLTEANVERAEFSPAQRENAQREVRSMIDRFVTVTGFQPKRIVPVAGALQYSVYSPLLRVVMKQLAKRNGGATDTRHDHEYTDWTALERLADELAEELGVRIPADTSQARPSAEKR